MLILATHVESIYETLLFLLFFYNFSNVYFELKLHLNSFFSFEMHLLLSLFFIQTANESIMLIFGSDGWSAGLVNTQSRVQIAPKVESKEEYSLLKRLDFQCLFWLLRTGNVENIASMLKKNNTVNKNIWKLSNLNQITRLHWILRI